ncbi:hypothetical protein GCM10027277_04880 [Pseudoduganella ginsengisoli]|uniref:Uncharacterized protein n=1 Tax=Pseudoduganella ginsengisoli TaxID=1462440 RepID=A0A6L6Q401_9BURK|nr:hypothetical protein [Pseudoduganella ginsengisoli]MTW04189.1 hypothetical protein [Pseudoduganella ginsengisoli]
MHLQGLITAIGALTAAISIPLAAWRPFKEHQDWIGAKAKHMREQCEFAEKLLGKIAEGKIDPYSKDLGLQALAGTTYIEAAEIEFVINLRKSPRDLPAYISGRRFFDSHKILSHHELAYKTSFQSASVRCWYRRRYYALYLACFTGASSPLLWPIIFRGDFPPAVILVFSAMLIPMALIFGKEAIDIERAEALMAAADDLRSAAGCLRAGGSGELFDTPA